MYLLISGWLLLIIDHAVTVYHDIELRFIWSNLKSSNFQCNQDHTYHGILCFIINFFVTYNDAFFKEPCKDNIDDISFLNLKLKRHLNKFMW